RKRLRRTVVGNIILTRNSQGLRLFQLCPCARSNQHSCNREDVADHRLRESPPGHARVDKYIAPERRGSGRGNNGFGAEQEQIEKVPEKDARRGFQLEQQFELSTWVRSHSFRRGAFG